MLIRDVDAEDLARIRTAAAASGTSLQGYLRDTVHAQAVYLRRHDALTRVERRLDGLPAVSEEDHDAVLDAIDDELEERGEPGGSDR